MINCRLYQLAISTLKYHKTKKNYVLHVCIFIKEIQFKGLWELKRFP